MKKLDLKRELKELYMPSSKEPAIVEVPAMNFLMIDGSIEPGMEPGSSPSFASATAKLYGAAYGLKFSAKKRADNPVDYQVMALEGLWWVDDGQFDIRRKDNWKWTLMIMQPDDIDRVFFDTTMASIRSKKGDAAVDGVRLERFEEGLCVQIMHIGPYATEPPNVDRLRAFAEEQGCRFKNHHHEIYIGDPRRADPAKLKTVLRHPIARRG